MSDQVEDCDRTISYMVRYGCGGGCAGESLPRADDYDEEDRLEASKNVEEYFANYGEGREEKEDINVVVESEGTVETKVELEDDEDFEKL
jgi:hypothetical protein